MLDMEVLVSGLLNGFLSGKHYNRYKCLHPMLANPFHSLYFKHFIKQCGDISEGVTSQLLAIADKPQQAMHKLELSEALSIFLKTCDEYTDNIEVENMDQLPSIGLYTLIWCLHIFSSVELVEPMILSCTYIFSACYDHFLLQASRIMPDTWSNLY